MYRSFSSFASTFSRSEKTDSIFIPALQVIGASIFLALCSQIRLQLPFSPIPITFQTLAILLIGGTLGSKKAFLAILAYYGQILSGLPVTSGGISNPLIFLGPKAGYVFGFAIQAYVMGWFAERVPANHLLTRFTAALLAMSCTLILGVLVLSFFIGLPMALTMGFYPFLVGDLFKAMIACLTLRGLQRFF